MKYKHTQFFKPDDNDQLKLADDLASPKNSTTNAIYVLENVLIELCNLVARDETEAERLYTMVMSQGDLTELQAAAWNMRLFVDHAQYWGPGPDEVHGATGPEDCVVNADFNEADYDFMGDHRKNFNPMEGIG